MTPDQIIESSPRSMPRLAIMQPYIFPYIGYFQLIDAASLFIFYDDVQYITNKSWINRNRILINGHDFIFSVPVANASQTALINETALAIDDRWRNKFQRTIINAYKKAPYFGQIESIITSVLDEYHCNVSELAVSSVLAVLRYLQVPFKYKVSSECSPTSRNLGRTERLVDITKSEGYSCYVNAAGGEKLYSKEYFATRGIEMHFLQGASIHYQQFSNPFVPSLSIIDVLMFNEPSVVRGFMKQYTLY